MPTPTTAPTPVPSRRRRRLARTAAALVVLAAGFALDRPAAANAVEMEIAEGGTEFWNPSLLNFSDLASAPTCAPPVREVTTAGTGGVAIEIRLDVVELFSSRPFRMVHELDLVGTFSGGIATLTGTWTIDATPTDGSCVPETGAGVCAVDIGILGSDGVFTASDPTNLVTGDLFEIEVYSEDTQVSGSTTDCNDLLEADNGVGILYLDLIVPGADSATVTGGSLALRETGGSTFDTIALGGGLGSCSAPAASVTAGGTGSGGALAVSMTSDRPYRSPGGTDFRVVTSTTLSGTHSSGSASVTGSSTATVTRTTGGFGSCTTTGGACTVTSSSLSLTGSFSVGSPPQYGEGDTLTLGGGNTAPNTVVSGTGTDCADLVAIDDGRITFTGLTLTGT